MSNGLNIEEIMRQEDEAFYASFDDDGSSKRKSSAPKRKAGTKAGANRTQKSKPKPKKVEEILTESNDSEVLRESIIGLLSGEYEVERETSFMEELDRKKSFPRREITADVKKLLIKYGFDPSKQAELQVISVFIQNLNSIS